MEQFSDLNIGIAKYKSFDEVGCNIPSLAPVTILIGRNNIGKSSILDVIEFLCGNKLSPNRAPSGDIVDPEVTISTRLENRHVIPFFQPSTAGGDLNGNHWEDFGKHLVGRYIKLKWQGNSFTFRSIEKDPFVNHPAIQNYYGRVASQMTSPFQGFHVRRIIADRDVKQEGNSEHIAIAQDGSGLTNALQRYLTQDDLPANLVRETLRSGLNEIFEPEIRFKDIIARRAPGGGEVWEIYLDEAEKGPVPLSRSGSGLKTVLLVLSNIILTPRIIGIQKKKLIFCFEEIENNLHPALLRRLLSYLRRAVVEEEFHLVLTSHSSITIDAFGRDESAEILHVTHSGRSSTVEQAKTYVKHGGILDDLDLRASDLLQANCIIWVEGPSDRIYFNRWIYLLTSGEIREGLHYQCMFYGGRLLSHLSADTPKEELDESIQILRLNRNAAILVDRDRCDDVEPINATKSRMIAEIEGIGGLGWVTEGIEIENYLSPSSLGILPDGEWSIFVRFPDLLQRAGLLEYKKLFEKSKPLFAERILPNITLDCITRSGHLKDHLDQVVAAVKRWNRIPD